MEVRDISISQLAIGKNDRIEPDDEIPDLAGNMERFGQLQPIIVNEHDGKLDLVSGARRVKGAEMRRLPTVAASVHRDLPPDQVAWIRLSENVMRKAISGSTASATRNVIALSRC